jgi:glutamate/tyrosine decarboxylase-like PLP-dependent enzyme
MSALSQDRAGESLLLEQAARQAIRFLESIAQRRVFQTAGPIPPATLPVHGGGAEAALKLFGAQFEPFLSASAGPRYLGFVTGGSTPAAVAADWLVSAYDQNLSHAGGSCAVSVELQALDLLRQLVGLPADFEGCLVTGATMANFCGLGTARQWCGERLGIDIAEAGLAAAPPIPVFAATPHASAVKALAMLGMGRAALQTLHCLPGREAMDMAALRTSLQQHGGKPSIVLASACTVNTADFDDLVKAAALCREFGAWLHVDAAFGLFAACSVRHAGLLRGLELADSITADAHKYLNVPYDCGLLFTRHLALQEKTFRASAAYLESASSGLPDLLQRTPESSRRFRALPVWMTLMAYGRDGYREIVECTCGIAESLGRWISASADFDLLAPVRLNIVCFAIKNACDEENRRFLRRIEADGRTFLTPTYYAGRPALRAAFSNWRTGPEDEEMLRAALTAAL